MDAPKRCHPIFRTLKNMAISITLHLPSSRIDCYCSRLVKMPAQDYALGRCCVRLDHLIFESGVRDYDEKNVTRLRNIYKTEGCKRADPDHFIPAVVSPSFPGIYQQDSRRLPDPEALPADFRILCLHGKHRILAAKTFLPYRDQWWTLALYDECKF